MSSWRRIQVVVLAMLALLIPLRASAGDGSGSLAVSASLAGCGLAGGAIVCEIEAGFNSISGADSYTASVTLADASVRSFGTVSPGGASLYVPYVGAGIYRVEITAWAVDDEGDTEPIDTAVSTTENVEPPPAPRESLKPADDPAAEEPAPAPEPEEATDEAPPPEDGTPPAAASSAQPAAPNCSTTNADGTPRTPDPTACPEAAAAPSAPPGAPDG